MNLHERKETAVHHAMALSGGFFGMYALTIRSATFGSSETSNLIYLVVAGLSGSLRSFLIRLGALVCYIAGIVFATLMPKILKKPDFRYISIGIDILACLMLAQLPEELDPVLALYPCSLPLPYSGWPLPAPQATTARPYFPPKICASASLP